MFKYLTKNNTRKYVDVLSKLVWRYNNSYHRSIKIKHVDVNQGNAPQVWINLYRQNKAHSNKKLSVDGKVCISIEKTIFQKRYDQLWTEEIFIITHVIDDNPICLK